MGRKRVEKTETLSTRLEVKEINDIRFISNILGINVAKFISMCIQEWMLNHSDFIKLINKELNNESRRETNTG